MNRIELNHWYMKENELSISLMKFYTKIKILKNDQIIYYQLYVKGSEDKDLIFNFYTIEDAILFTEQVIAKSHDTDEVLRKYISMFENEKFKGPHLKKENDIKSEEEKMDTKKVFEETGKLGNEIHRLGKQLEKVNKQCFEMMKLCPHEIVFKYTDNHPRMLMIDGTYFCPACGKSIRCIKSEQLQESAFKDSRIIPLTNLSLFGTSEVHHSIRNEVYQNMKLYYNPELDVEELSNRMEEILKDKEQRYERITKTLRKTK